MRGAMPNQQAVILLMGTVAQNVDIYKYRKTQVFRLIPHPHYRLEPDKIKRPEKNPVHSPAFLPRISPMDTQRIKGRFGVMEPMEI